MTVPDSSDAARISFQEKLQELLHKQHAIVERLTQGQVQLKRLARSVWHVQEQERRKLARDLHDGIGQNLSAVMNLIDRASATHVSAELETARALVETTLKETRELSRLLRPQVLDDLGIQSALHWLVRTLGETHNLQISLRIDNAMPELDAELSTLIFRLTQEALHNAIRHAHASQITVQLRSEATKLHLNISDNGIGCDMQQACAAGRDGQSSGLGGMRDRVRLYDGEIDFQSSPGQGMKVVISVPLRSMPDTVAQ